MLGFDLLWCTCVSQDEDEVNEKKSGGCDRSLHLFETGAGLNATLN